MAHSLAQGLRLNEWGDDVSPPLVIKDKPPGLVGEIAEWTYRTGRVPNWNLSVGVGEIVVGAVGAPRLLSPTASSLVIYLLGLAGTGWGKQHILDCLGVLCRVVGVHCSSANFGSKQGLQAEILEHRHMVSARDEYGDWLSQVTHGNNLSSPLAGVLEEDKKLWGLNMPWAVYQIDRIKGSGGEVIERPTYLKYDISTSDALYSALRRKQVTGGWLNRHIVSEASAREPERDPEWSLTDGVPQKLVDGLKELVRFAEAKGHQRLPNSNLWQMEWDGRQARDRYRALVDRMSGGKTEYERDLQVRVAENAVRRSAILALGQLKKLMGETDMAWGEGMMLTSYAKMSDSMDKHYHEDVNTFELADRIYEWLLLQTERQATLSKISKKWGRSAKYAVVLNSALDVLIDQQGRVRRGDGKSRPQGGGKPSDVYEALMEGDV